MMEQLSLLPSPQTHPRPSYHSRRPIPGPAVEASAEIKRGEKKARQQEEAILAFFRVNPGAWSPSQVLKRVSPIADGYMSSSAYAWPITSVRRGITNLTDRGRLRRTDERVMGPFGAKEFLWELTEEGKK